MSDIVEPRITGINKSIIDSYQNLGGINHITGPNLPSPPGRHCHTRGFRIPDFPWISGPRRSWEDDLIAYTIGAKTRRLVRELTIEISRSLEYAVRSEGRESVPGTCRKKAENIALDLLELIPSLRERAMGDVEAAYKGDPAAKSRDEVILSYPGLEAVACYRVAHELYARDVPLIPRMMSEHVHKNTGIDIHPGAQIDDGFFIDHATGVVVGETAVIGKNVNSIRE
jgi:serine O-acetyltransferase